MKQAKYNNEDIELLMLNSTYWTDISDSSLM